MSIDYLESASRLANIGPVSDDSWHEVETTAQNLANGLRVKDEDIHTVLGKTELPQTLTLLLEKALNGASIPDDSRTSAVFEIFRVAANLCMDHDENRGHLLEAGLPQAIVSLLEGYADLIPIGPQAEPLALPIPHLKVVRTAIGVLLNACIGYDSIKFRLISLEAAVTILRLSTAIYPPGSWLTAAAPDGTAQDIIVESWAQRSGLSNWAWRTISELKDVKDDSRQIFGPDALPLLVPSLLAFLPPDNKPSSTSFFANDSAVRASLLQTDFDILEESCMLVESLSLDVEDVRLSLARGLYFPAEHGGVPCLSTMLDFIEKGDYQIMWYNTSGMGEAEIKRKERSFDICKAAVIKVVVEVAGEDKNDDVLWDELEEGKPGGEFVCRMVKWIKSYVDSMGQGGGSGKISDNVDARATVRDDLVICASLSLGNLARRENHTITLLSPPHSLAPVLSSTHLLSPSADIKLKHGIIGLLKHLAQSSSQSPATHATLGNAGVIQCLVNSGVWDEKTDAMAEVVQLGAIGVVKHLCNNNAENTFTLVLPSESSSPEQAHPTGLAQILALVRRSDSVPVRSEGTRVLVNVIKSLFSSGPVVNHSSSVSTHSPNNGVQTERAGETERKKQESIGIVLTPQCALALASLVGRGGKYPQLVNEGVVALSLMSTTEIGAPLVLEALLSILPPDRAASMPTSDSPAASTSSEVGSPVVTSPVANSPTSGRLPPARRPIDMVVAVLKNRDTGPHFPVEVRTNVCSLLTQLVKNGSGERLQKVKESTEPILKRLAETPPGSQGGQGKEGILTAAAKRLLDIWV